MSYPLRSYGFCDDGEYVEGLEHDHFKEEDFDEGDTQLNAPKPARKSTKGRQLKRWDGTSSLVR